MRFLLIMMFYTLTLHSYLLDNKLPKETTQLIDSFECFSKDDKTIIYAYVLAHKYRMNHIDDRDALVKGDLDYWRLWHLVSDLEYKCKLNYQFSHIVEETILQTEEDKKIHKRLARLEGSINTDGTSESSARMRKYDKKLRQRILDNPPKYTVLKKSKNMEDYNLKPLKDYKPYTIPKNIYEQIEKKKITPQQKDILFRDAYLVEEMIRSYDKPKLRHKFYQEMLYLDECKKMDGYYLRMDFYPNFKRKLSQRVITSGNGYYPLKTEFLPKEVESYCEHNITKMKLSTFVPKKEKKSKKKVKELVAKLENLKTFLSQFDNNTTKKKYANEYLSLMKKLLESPSGGTPNVESLKLLRLKNCLVANNDKDDFALIMARVKDFRLEGLKETFYTNIFNSQRWWFMTIRMKIDAEGESYKLKHFFDCNQTLFALQNISSIKNKFLKKKKKIAFNATQTRDAYWLNNEILKNYAVIFENKPTINIDNSKAIDVGLISKKNIDENGNIKIYFGNKFLISGMPNGGINLTYHGIPKGKACTDFIQSHSLNDTIFFNNKTYEGLDYIMINKHKIKLKHYVYKYVQKLCNKEDNNTISFVKETTMKKHKYKGRKLGASYDNVILLKSMDYRGSDIEMSPDKKFFAITTEAKLFDTKTLLPIMNLDSGGGSDIRLAFSSDNHWLSVGNYHNFVSVWDMQNLSKYHKIKTERNGGNSSFIFLSDNRTIGVHLGTMVYFIDINTQKTLSILKPKWKEHSKLYPTGILSMAYSKENKELYIGGGAGKIEIWDIVDINNPKYVGELEDKHIRRVSVLKVDPKDNNILISGDNKGIKFWDIKNKKVVRRLIPDNYNEFKNIVISDDYHYLIASGGNANIWNLSDGKQIDILSGGGTDHAEDVIFLPQSHKFITIGGGSVGMPHMHIWEIKK